MNTFFYIPRFVFAIRSASLFPSHPLLRLNIPQPFIPLLKRLHQIDPSLVEHGQGDDGFGYSDSLASEDSSEAEFL